jgi:hypothetical protein
MRNLASEDRRRGDVRRVGHNLLREPDEDEFFLFFSPVTL